MHFTCSTVYKLETVLFLMAFVPDAVVLTVAQGLPGFLFLFLVANMLSCITVAQTGLFIR